MYELFFNFLESFVHHFPLLPLLTTSPTLDNIRLSDCLKDKREYYQNSSVLDCVTQYSQSAAHLCEQFYRSNRLGLLHRDPYAVRRGGCLELYYCNMVEWFWWDSSLISTTNWFPSVL